MECGIFAIIRKMILATSIAMPDPVMLNASAIALSSFNNHMPSQRWPWATISVQGGEGIKGTFTSEQQKSKTVLKKMSYPKW